MADGQGECPSLSSIEPASLGAPELLSAGESDPEFVNDADRLRFQCPVHKGLVRNTRQTPCGHRICQECVTVWLNGATSRRCPEGEMDCEEVTEANVTVDRSVQRDMKSMQVFCRNKSEGCPVKLLFKNHKSHLVRCEFQRVPCEHKPRGCNETVLRGKLKEHHNQCPFRPVRCKLCSVEVNQNQLKDHDADDCQEAVTGCLFGCENKKLKRKEVLDHRDVCPVHPVDCKFKDKGCKFVGKREAMEKHEKEKLGEHLELLTNEVTKLQNNSQETWTELRTLSAKYEQLQQLFRSAERETTSQQFKKLDDQIQDMKLKLVNTLEKTITTERQIARLVERPRVEAIEQTMQGLQLRVTQLEGQRERQALLGGAGGSTQVARLGTVGDMAETVYTQLTQFQQGVELQNTRFAEMDLRFQLLETASYNGTLVWKIRDFAQRRRDAASSRTLSLYSQPFYSHRFGYRMCGRVYPNGDGEGKGTHLSAFFTIMKGEYDALLEWPFRQKVTISVLDQSSQRRHMKESFSPHTSTSFQKPVSEMNAASGFPKFIAHTVLENENNHYLKDDAVFIHITVDPDPDPHFF